MLNDWDPTSYASWPFLQPTAHAQQVIKRLQEVQRWWSYLCPIPQKKTNCLFCILTLNINFHYKRVPINWNQWHVVLHYFIWLHGSTVRLWIAVLVIVTWTICHSDCWLKVEKHAFSENGEKQCCTYYGCKGHTSPLTLWTDLNLTCQPLEIIAIVQNYFWDTVSISGIVARYEHQRFSLKGLVKLLIVISYAYNIETNSPWVHF